MKNKNEKNYINKFLNSEKNPEFQNKIKNILNDIIINNQNKIKQKNILKQKLKIKTNELNQIEIKKKYKTNISNFINHKEINQLKDEIIFEEIINESLKLKLKKINKDILILTVRLKKIIENNDFINIKSLQLNYCKNILENNKIHLIFNEIMFNNEKVRKENEFKKTKNNLFKKQYNTEKRNKELIYQIENIKNNIKINIEYLKNLKQELENEKIKNINLNKDMNNFDKILNDINYISELENYLLNIDKNQTKLNITFRKNSKVFEKIKNELIILNEKINNNLIIPNRNKYSNRNISLETKTVIYLKIKSFYKKYPYGPEILANKIIEKYNYLKLKKNKLTYSIETIYEILLSRKNRLSILDKEKQNKLILFLKLKNINKIEKKINLNNIPKHKPIYNNLKDLFLNNENIIFQTNYYFKFILKKLIDNFLIIYNYLIKIKIKINNNINDFNKLIDSLNIFKIEFLGNNEIKVFFNEKLKNIFEDYNFKNNFFKMKIEQSIITQYYIEKEDLLILKKDKLNFIKFYDNSLNRLNNENENILGIYLNILELLKNKKIKINYLNKKIESQNIFYKKKITNRSISKNLKRSDYSRKTIFQLKRNNINSSIQVINHFNDSLNIKSYKNKTSIFKKIKTNDSISIDFKKKESIKKEDSSINNENYKFIKNISNNKNKLQLNLLLNKFKNSNLIRYRK